jgi:hypothetical protein
MACRESEALGGKIFTIARYVTRVTHAGWRIIHIAKLQLLPPNNEVVSRLNENDGFCSYGCDRKFHVCWYSVRNAEDAGRYVPLGAEQTDRHLRQQRRTQRAIAKWPRNDGPDSAELIKRQRQPEAAARRPRFIADGLISKSVTRTFAARV